MTFQNLNIKSEYRSKHIDVIENFYIPLFSNAILYRRAVGFFSSGVLARYAVGLKKMVENHGRIQLVASPKLTSEDLEAINKGYELRNEIMKNALLREMKEPQNLFEKESLNLLANYIAQNKLDIKIAIINENKNIGIYHEKLGLLYDKEKNIVAFTGSSNESLSAVDYNYETIDTFCSWKIGEFERVQLKEKAFETIWDNNDNEIEILDFPDVKKELLQKYQYKQEITDPYQVLSMEKKQKIGIPHTVQLYDYQLNAINEWEKKGFRGIFDMATGTGKTYTGIGAICHLYQKKKGHLAAVIVCPQKHLVEQWVEDLQVFGIQPIVAYGIPKYKNYPLKLRQAVFNYKLKVINSFFVICTLSTFASEKFQERICQVKSDLLLVVDEAHNIGAKNYSAYLKDYYQYRLALSATFERHNDEEGTDILYRFFGEKCINYSLEEAIEQGKLTKYKYYPICVYFTDQECADYNKISKEIAQNVRINNKGKKELNSKGKQLAITRARMIAGASQKINALMTVMDTYKNESHILVYCGATQVEQESEASDRFPDDIRQIDAISKKLGLDLEMKVAQFTSRENMKQRQQLKDEFSKGDTIQALIAIKCLDEGVNIPAIKTAFILASTTNPKEYIQRRGRVLRLYPGKDYAEIYDFITLPYDLDTAPFLPEESRHYAQSLVKRELDRMQEFQRLADNGYQSFELLQHIKEAYQMYNEEEEL